MDDMFEKGVANRKLVLGEGHVARKTSAVDDFSRPLNELGTRYCWGELWSRDGLPWKTRSLINVALLAALNRPNEFKLHVGGALRNGATKEEIQEVLLQIVIYCGLPAGSQAFRLAKEYFAENEAQPSDLPPSR
jgi:4-carboxymuconolactone decarboxylase